MNSEIAPSEVETQAYEPPALRFLGNAHELLAMAKSAQCDQAGDSFGNFFLTDPACEGP